VSCPAICETREGAFDEFTAAVDKISTGDLDHLYIELVDLGKDATESGFYEKYLGHKILEQANRENHDMLIMAKHGHGALKGALIGDTCQHVVRRCRKPALIVEVPPKEEVGD